MGRGRDSNQGGRGGKGWGRGKSYPKGGRSSNSSSNNATKKKTLKDYQYYIGSSKSNNDCQLTTDFIINYIWINFEHGDDIATALEHRQEWDPSTVAPALSYSTISGTDAAEVARRNAENKQYEMEFSTKSKMHFSRLDKYLQNRVKAYGIIWQACTITLQSKIEARKDYDVIKGDPIKTLAAIEEHAMSYQENKYPFDVVLQALRTLLATRQKDDEKLIDYTKRFKTN